MPIFEESEEHEIAGDIPEPFSPSGNADSKTRSLLRTFVRFRMQILEARWLAGWLVGECWLDALSGYRYAHTLSYLNNAFDRVSKERGEKKEIVGINKVNHELFEKYYYTSSSKLRFIPIIISRRDEFDREINSPN